MGQKHASKTLSSVRSWLTEEIGPYVLLYEYHYTSQTLVQESVH